MPCMFYYENALLPNLDCPDVESLKEKISQDYGVPADDLFVVIDGRKIFENLKFNDLNYVVRVYKRLLGGKGGFGSMLRAIGAQIEKTTNREACRDLSGRRLRDINEEKRLRKWLQGQEDREKEAAERKQKKLERLIAEPKIDVNLNPMYEKERQELPERVSAAVDAGWQAAGSSNEVGSKRKLEEDKPKGMKKAKLWIDAELSDCSSLSDDEEEEATTSRAQAVSTDSGNESDKNSESSKVNNE
ncbi:splicing regulator SDE2 [Plodia interpunctella]|uniref:splicing regulator SDE2 n=1 Tax=Plodia interpunctella TaxID=58824 RepID=UPI002367F120|nr:splicing regulator SDE2 [Plodia interpunctella]